HRKDQERHTPELPRRCDPSRWVSTTPTASISANIVVGPTKTNPSRRSARASATDSAEVVGTSAGVAGAGVLAGWKDQMRSTNPPRSRSVTVARALVMVAWILARFRTI